MVVSSPVELPQDPVRVGTEVMLNTCGWLESNGWKEGSGPCVPGKQVIEDHWPRPLPHCRSLPPPERGLGRERGWHPGLPTEGSEPVLYIERNGNLIATRQTLTPIERQLLLGWPKPHCRAAVFCPGHPKPPPRALRARRSGHLCFTREPTSRICKGPNTSWGPGAMGGLGPDLHWQLKYFLLYPLLAV